MPGEDPALFANSVRFAGKLGEPGSSRDLPGGVPPEIRRHAPQRTRRSATETISSRVPATVEELSSELMFARASTDSVNHAASSQNNIRREDQAGGGVSPWGFMPYTAEPLGSDALYYFGGKPSDAQAACINQPCLDRDPISRCKSLLGLSVLTGWSMLRLRELGLLPGSTARTLRQGNYVEQFRKGWGIQASAD